MVFHKQQRVAVYIDGSNFYFKLKLPDVRIERTTRFDYRGLSAWLARGRSVVSCHYYVGVVRADPTDTKGQELRRNQQRLFAHLQSPTQNIVIQRGYIMNHAGVFHEKGVDVQLAVDLVIGAYEDAYDAAILLSSDTDLIPAIRKVRQRGKDVEYIGFANQPSIALQKAATLSRLLIRDELLPFAQ